MQHSDLQKTLHELQSEIRSLSDQQVGGCWCRQFMDWCLLFLYKPEWCLPCIGSTKHGNGYDYDCPSWCCGNLNTVITVTPILGCGKQYTFAAVELWQWRDSNETTSSRITAVCPCQFHADPKPGYDNACCYAITASQLLDKYTILTQALLGFVIANLQLYYTNIRNSTR